ncbi:Gamma-glutamyl phosphate reductase [Rickettsiales bacterium Ac37b]|nr:Gamma-glutamyl phosphate reductase [Rickettsiales bacterium Ac37b]
MNITNELTKVKQASSALFLLNDEQINNVLNELALVLLNNAVKIIAENKKDLASMDKGNPMYDRLFLDENRIRNIADSIKKVALLPTPIKHILQKKIMQNGLTINKISVPLGVIAVIYESRPNVTMDVFSLCFKSCNGCILKGGKEAYYSNVILVSIIKEVLVKNHINPNIIALFSLNRKETKNLIMANGLIDACIPRGSKNLIDFVRENATIPIIETGAGVVHLYFDLHGDITKGKNIINNSKTRRVSVCNALDCLLIHKDRLYDLYTIIEPLQSHNVELFVDKQAYQILKDNYPANLLSYNEQEIYGQEFLSYKMSIKTVTSLDEAIQHVTNYTSGHSEAIITEDNTASECFIQSIDAAVVYINASTAFTDGEQFGMGAEIGISTQKLHARGPMGLDSLTSYKWIVYGSGQIRE